MGLRPVRRDHQLHLRSVLGRSLQRLLLRLQWEEVLSQQQQLLLRLQWEERDLQLCSVLGQSLQLLLLRLQWEERDQQLRSVLGRSLQHRLLTHQWKLHPISGGS